MKFESLVSKIVDAGYEPRSYSGRFMYGKDCLGVDLPDASCLVELGGCPKPTLDSMGRGIIAYWPSIAWQEVTGWEEVVEEDQDDEEEEEVCSEIRRNFP